MKKIKFYVHERGTCLYIFSTGLKFCKNVHTNNKEIFIYKEDSNTFYHRLNFLNMKELDIFEILFNEEYKEQLSYIIKGCFSIIKNKNSYYNRHFFRSGIKTPEESRNLYKYIIKDLFKEYKSVFKETEFSQYQNELKNL